MGVAFRARVICVLCVELNEVRCDFLSTRGDLLRHALRKFYYCVPSASSIP